MRAFYVRLRGLGAFLLLQTPCVRSSVLTLILQALQVINIMKIGMSADWKDTFSYHLREKYGESPF